MNIFSAVVVFVLIWWMVFFCALPFGIKSIEKPEGGIMPGAPINPGLKRKMIISTAITVVLWGVALYIIKSDMLSFHDLAKNMKT